MKFRALNFDYHAEATFRFEESSAKSNNSNAVPVRILIQAGKYDTNSTSYASASSSILTESKPGSTESLSPVGVAEEFSHHATSVSGDKLDREDDFARYKESGTLKNDPFDTRDSKTMSYKAESIDIVATTQTLDRKAIPKSRCFLTVAQFSRVLQTICDDTKTRRLANVSWDEALRKSSRAKEPSKIPFLAYPLAFYQAATAATREVFLRNNFSISLFQPRRIETTLPLVENRLNQGGRYHSKMSWQVFTFGLHRICRIQCAQQIQRERTSSYSWGKTQGSTMTFDNLMYWALKITIAALHHSDHAPSFGRECGDSVLSIRHRCNSIPLLMQSENMNSRSCTTLARSNKIDLLTILPHITERISQVTFAKHFLTINDHEQQQQRFEEKDLISKCAIWENENAAGFAEKTRKQRRDESDVGLKSNRKKLRRALKLEKGSSEKKRKARQSNDMTNVHRSKTLKTMSGQAINPLAVLSRCIYPKDVTATQANNDNTIDSALCTTHKTEERRTKVPSARNSGNQNSPLSHLQSHMHPHGSHSTTAQGATTSPSLLTRTRHCKEGESLRPLKTKLIDQFSCTPQPESRRDRMRPIENGKHTKQSEEISHGMKFISNQIEHDKLTTSIKSHHSKPKKVQTIDERVLQPVKLFCSEDLIERWSETIVELASGRWKSDGIKDPKDTSYTETAPSLGRKIILIDNPLIAECGVDIEASSRSGIVIYSASTLESAASAKQMILESARLVAIGRYLQLSFFICYDTTITSSIAKHVAQLQSALCLPNEETTTEILVKTVTPKTLSVSLAQTIFSLPTAGPNLRFLEEAAVEVSGSSLDHDRSHFLLSLVPVLSVNGAIQCVLLAKQFLPPGSPYFELLFKNQRLRQQIMLTATSEVLNSDVHPEAMTQLSRVVVAFVGPDVNRDDSYPIMS